MQDSIIIANTIFPVLLCNIREHGSFSFTSWTQKQQKVWCNSPMDYSFSDSIMLIYRITLAVIFIIVAFIA